MKIIKNFNITAHINHGKTTLASKLIGICKKIKIKNNILDYYDIEIKKNITTKSQCITLNYKYNNILHTLNLIDTPGHEDFNYEVLKSIVAIEGSILIIDHIKGIQAQTIINYNRIKKNKLNIIFIINKIDIKNKYLIKKKKIKNKIQSNDIINSSAKTGYNIKEIIYSIIKNIKKLKINIHQKLISIIINSWFNKYIGITCLIKIKKGKLNKKNKIKIYTKKYIYKINNIGICIPEKINKKNLINGEIGFITIYNKKLQNLKIGNIILNSNNNNKYFFQIKKFTPKFFINIHPIKNIKYKKLKKSLSQILLSNPLISIKSIYSNIFGLGFKCGFLGTLHMEIIKNQLKTKYLIDTIFLKTNITYKIYTNKYKIIKITSNQQINKFKKIKQIFEPISNIKILVKNKYTDKIIKKLKALKIKNINTIYIKKQIYIKCKIKTSKTTQDFYKDIKNISQGFYSIKQYFYKFKKSNLININIYINNKKIELLNFIINKQNLYKESKIIIKNIKKNTKRKLFNITIHIKHNSKIISKESIKPLKKNILSKCYGGDLTRKKKLIKKQQIGKKFMKKNSKITLNKKIIIKMLKIVNKL